MRDFGYTGKPETCLWCGRNLHRTVKRVWDNVKCTHTRNGYEYGGAKGVGGNGHFCTGACMQQFGLHAARCGTRFQKAGT